MAHSLTNLLYHVIFSTKERRPLIRENIRQRLFKYLAGAVRNVEGASILVGGTANHVHLLMSLPGKVSIADAVRTVKAASSRWMSEVNQNAESFAWQTGYGAFSVSQSRKDAVAGYIRDQENHHRQRTFEEEYLDFLKKNEISFDERFVLD